MFHVFLHSYIIYFNTAVKVYCIVMEPDCSGFESQPFHSLDLELWISCFLIFLASFRNTYPHPTELKLVLYVDTLHNAQQN